MAIPGKNIPIMGTRIDGNKNQSFITSFANYTIIVDSSSNL
jgi:sRNA-binding regulator protein Hfq